MKQFKVCLNMIVKNESHCIERCLNSVKQVIDSWVIVDTGSTDGTQKVILECMEGIPGALYEREWVDFASNRNQAIDLAKEHADYLFFIDADETLKVKENFTWPELTWAFYMGKVITPENQIESYRHLLVSTEENLYWTGVLHETLDVKSHHTYGVLEGLSVQISQDGNRSLDPQKYEKDLKVLQKAIETESENGRYLFYLARTYLVLGELPSALLAFEKRSQMEGDEGEVFYSLFMAARLKDVLEKTLQISSQEIIGSYEKAFFFRPSRIEPLFYLALYHTKKGEYRESYFTAKKILNFPFYDDGILMEKNVYLYERFLAFAESAYEIGAYENALWAWNRLLAIPELPKKRRELLESLLPTVLSLSRGKEVAPPGCYFFPGKLL